MADDMSAIAAPDTPSAVDLALAGGPAMGGTPDPNAPVPMMQPPQVSPDQAAAQFPYPASGIAADVLSSIQPGQNAPAQPPQQMPPLPDETQQHMSLLHRILDKVGTILGGDETLHVTKDVDGNVTMTKDPSTEGEKWGRIAQAALTGAGVGFAASQGPGGMAKAAGAGIQAGLKLPQQNQQQTEQEVSFQNKQLMSKAQHSLLDQQILAAQFRNQVEPLKFSEEQADYALKMKSEMDDLGGVLVGNVKTPQDLLKYKTDQEATDAHTGKSDGVLMPIPKADGSTDIYRIPPNLAKQRTTTDWTYQQSYLDPEHPDKVLQRPFTEIAGTGTMADRAKGMKALMVANDKVASQAATNAKNLADANKPPVDPKTDPEMILSKYKLQYPNDPQRALREATAEIHRNQMALKETGAATGAGVGGITPQTQIADLIKPGGVFAPGTINGTNAQKLADGSMVLNDLPKRMAKGVPTPQETAAAAEAYSQAMYGLPWSETNIQQEKKFFSDLKVQGATDGIDKMIGHDGQPGFLDKVLKLAKTANIGPSAPINQLTLWVKTNMGDQAAKDYMTALGEVQRTLPSLIGNPLLGGSDSDLKLKEAQKMFGSNPSLGNLISTSQVLSDMLHGSVNSYASQNRYLQRRYGMQGPYAKQFGMPGTGGAQATGAPQQSPQPRQQPAVPPGKFAHRTNGVIDGYADDQKGTNYVPLK